MARMTIGQFMRLTVLAAVDLVLLKEAGEVLTSPAVLLPLTALNGVVVESLVFGRPLRRSVVPWLAACGVVAVAFGSASRPWSSLPLPPWTAGALSVAWAAALLTAWFRPAADGEERKPTRLDLAVVLAALLVGGALTFQILKRLDLDARVVAAVLRGDFDPPGSASSTDGWRTFGPGVGRTLLGRTAHDLITDPRSAWEPSDSFRGVAFKGEITKRWLLIDPNGPRLLVQVASDFVSLWPIPMLLGVTFAVLRLRGGPRWGVVLAEPGFWASVAPLASLLASVFMGGVPGLKFSPLLPAGAVALAWLALAASLRWRASPSWLDRAGRALGVAWLLLLLLGLWCFRAGLILGAVPSWMSPVR